MVLLRRALWGSRGGRVCGWLPGLGGCLLGLQVASVGGCGRGRVVVRGWFWVTRVGFGGWCGLLEWVGLVLGRDWGLGMLRGWDPRVGLRPRGFGGCGLVAEGLVGFWWCAGLWVARWVGCRLGLLDGGGRGRVVVRG